MQCFALCHVGSSYAMCARSPSMQFSVRLLAVKGLVSHDVIMACLSQDIIVVDQIGMEKLVHLSEGSGSEILTYVQQADEVRCVLIHSAIGGEDHIVYVYVCAMLLG